MANIDEHGHIVINSAIDEHGMRIFGSFSERGRFVLGRIFYYTFVEHLSISPSLVRTFDRDMPEPVRIGVTKFVAFNKTLQENLHINVSRNLIATRTIVTSILLSPTVSREMILTRLEQVNVADNLGKMFTLLEEMHVADSCSRVFTRTLTETLSILDSVVTDFTFVMRKLSTAAKSVKKHTSIYANKMISIALRQPTHSNVTEQTKGSTITPTHEHTNISLEDGRELQ